MTKNILIAALAAAFAGTCLAQASAPMAADGASAPAKAKRAHKPRHPASAAVSPLSSVDKKGGQ